MKSVKATWKESRLTGAVSSYKEKEVLTTVGIQVVKMTLNGEDFIFFRRTKMKNEDDGDFQPNLGGFALADKETVVNALKTYSDKLAKPFSQKEGDTMETVYEEGPKDTIAHMAITYFVKNRKKYIQVSFGGEGDETVFVLDKVAIDQLRSKISQIK